MKFTTIRTPDGPFTVLAADGVVLASGWTADPEAILARLPTSERPRRAESVPDSDPDVTAIAAAVQRYYGGDLRAVDDVPVRQFGTTLQMIGWQALREIPPGAPLSYTEFAAFLGRPAAVRAAAGICARNAPALFVPCHRVLRSDGSLGGFAWGLDVKRSLLEREGR